MHYVGVDLHKEQSWFYIMDEKGNKVASKSIANQPEKLKQYFMTIPHPFILAVEATYNWYFFVDLAEHYAENVYLANSYELKAFAKRHKKTDKIDARLIADILRKGYLPTVTIPDKNIRRIKEYLRYRMGIVTDRTRLIAKLKAILDKLGQDSTGDFTTYKRLATLAITHLSIEYQIIITSHIERIKHLTKTISETELFLESKAFDDEDTLNLVSIPGIGNFSALLSKSEIIDINRFASFERLCAYAGLAPRVNQFSYGPLNKNRRKALHWILIEVVHHFIRSVPEQTKLYEKLERRKGRNTAKIIIARKLLKIIYHILKEKRKFFVAKNTIRSVAKPALCGV